ncbi:hypothetical protein E8F20_05690 [Pseudomonas sp. BN415]|uniref:phage tail protein n=1 Tax=Pseudomonas sp. BN415 TaxID=2567889 RepID=UPI002458D597|nr:phage tail protein [Pseudomonas sp. BN415]MDH4581367.1 hypothetical protein [Pseudomonas sp. BN415]
MSTGQALGAVVGGTIGFFVGGPAGALYGAQIGLAAGGYLDPPKGPTVHGPRLGDRSVQTSTYGTILTRYYGTIGAHGNATWLENGELKETVRKKKRGGKGGGSVSTVKTYTYSATFFLSLGLGPIAGIRRMWCQGKLIYNAGSDDLETIIASNQAATGWRLYRGTDDQLPDPRYEADVGVGNAPAYRGEAYIAFYDFELADYGNSLQGAQFKVEVVNAGSTGKRKLYDQAITLPLSSNFSVRPVQRSLTTQPGLLAFYVYDPTAGFTGGIPTDERVIALGSEGNYLRAETFPGDVLRPQFSSSGTLTIRAGALDGSNVWAPEYATTFPIGSTRDILPFGDLTNPNTVNVTGSRGDLTDLLPGESGRYLHGAAFSPDGTQLILMTGALPGSASNQANRYFVLGADASLIESGTISGASRIFPPFDNLNLLNGATAYDPANGLVWTAWFAGSEAFVAGYSLADGELQQDYFDSTGFITGVGYPAACALDGMFYVLLPYGGARHWRVYQKNFISVDQESLANIIEREIERSSLLTAADIDTSLLTDTVRGYRVSGGSIRSALEPPQGTWPFDMIQSGYVLKPVPRGQASVMTIPWQDLGASDGDTPGDLLQESREMDSQLPARTSIKYLDAAREYAVAEQSAARDNTPAINRVDRELPIVLTADEAAGVADVLQELAWLERSEYAFSLPPIYLALEPADVVTIAAPWATFELRITEINYAPDGRLECKAKPNRAALYTSNAKGGEGVQPVGTIPLAGPSLFLPMDIPVVDETLQNAPGFAGVMTGYNPSWPGGLAVRSVDSGQTWNDLQGFTGLPTLGTARGRLLSSTCTLIDQRTLTVDLVSGELESITRNQMLSGMNYAAYGVDGRWEIVRFQTATLQGDGSYLISGFVRGDRGTEWVAGLHQNGEWFVLLDDPDNVFIDMAVGSIGVPATYRGITSGATIDSASDVPFTYQGVNLECLSPVSAKGSRDGSSNFSSTFTRRSRLSSSWWANGVEAPLGESAQAYEIDVMSGSTVKRTITASTPAFSYSAANQVSDFGSTQAAITFRIYQLSATVGRGYPLEVTL